MLHDKTLARQAMEAKTRVFWQPGFFLTMVFLMSTPYPGAVLDPGRAAP